MDQLLSATRHHVSATFLVAAFVLGAAASDHLFADSKQEVETAMSSVPQQDEDVTPAGAGAAAPARDGNIAILEEFAAAEALNTVEAYQLFIARHPDHPKAELARARIEAMR